MIQEIFRAFMFIFVAEMGDKTQILAMAFSTKFPTKKVLFGIAIGSFLNHGLAVLFGSLLSNLIPINTIQLIAGVAFICFAFWSLKIDGEEEGEEPAIKFGPVLTVSLAFFLGELGDKTQLTAITLSADSSFPYMILIGTVFGMVVTGFVGIFIGKRMGDKVPEIFIKLVASLVFMIFGIQKLYQNLPDQFRTLSYVISFLVIIGVLMTLMIRKLVLDNRNDVTSRFIAQSKALYDYYNHIEKDLENICVGSTYCDKCDGDNCVVGHAKLVVSDYRNADSNTYTLHNEYLHKPFTTESVIDSLIDTLLCIENNENDDLTNVHTIRKQLEYILLDETIERYIDKEKYFDELSLINSEQGEKLKKLYNNYKE